MGKKNVSVSAYPDRAYSTGLLSGPVLLGLCGGRLPAGLHEHSQPLLLQSALAHHHPSVRVLPPVDLDGY